MTATGMVGRIVFAVSGADGIASTRSWELRNGGLFTPIPGRLPLVNAAPTSPARFDYTHVSDPITDISTP